MVQFISTSCVSKLDNLHFPNKTRNRKYSKIPKFLVPLIVWTENGI